MKKFFTFVAALIASASMWGATYTVQTDYPNADGNIRRTLRGDYGLMDGDTILLTTGDYYEASGLKFQDKSNIVLKAAEGATPIVHQGTYNQIYVPATVEGIHFDGGDSAEYTFYFYETNAEKLDLQGCEFTGFKKYCISGSSSAMIDSIVVNNCFFHDNTGVSAIYLPTGSTADICNYVSITNTTICNMGTSGGEAGVIDIREKTTEASNQKIVIDHVTIYNLTNSYERMIQAYKSHNVVVSNTIIAQPTSTSLRPTYLYGGNVTNCLTYNVGNHKSSATCSGNLTGDPKFVDAANNNFKLGLGSPAINAATDGTNLGDPRWGNETPQTALVETAAKQGVKKMMVNGQMVIVRDGMMYNALGTKL